MKQTRILVLIATLLLTGSTLSAQQNQYNTGSVYSFLGLGHPVDFKSSYAAGMGLTGVAFSNRFSGTLSNPALWSDTYFTLGNGGLILSYHGAEDEFGKSDNTNFGVHHFQVQLPLMRDKLGLSASLAPLTQSRFSYTRDISEIIVQDTINYSIFNRGEGGLNRLELGLGYRINKYLSVGYAGSVVFGVQKNSSFTVFDTPGYAVTTETERTSSVGFGNRFGVLVSLPGLLRAGDALTLGSTLTLPVNLNSERESTVRADNIEIILEPEQAFGDGAISLPQELLLGLAYNTNRYFMASGEILMQNWSKYENFQGINEDFMKDRVKFGLGIEYYAYRRPENNIFTRFIYRAGASFDSGHLTLNDKDIQTVLFSAGIGIPIGLSPFVFASSIDVNFDYGFRGTTSHELVREKIFAVRVSFNLSELMFLQRRLQ